MSSALYPGADDFFWENSIHFLQLRNSFTIPAKTFRRHTQKKESRHHAGKQNKNYGNERMRSMETDVTQSVVIGGSFTQFNCKTNLILRICKLECILITNNTGKVQISKRLVKGYHTLFS